MRKSVVAGLAWVALALPAAAHQPALIEPSLRLPPSPEGRTRIALTFDACSGGVDRRILDALEANRIPATIFVTGRWLRHNRATFAELLAHPDLFEIEDHGERHLPAIDVAVSVYGLRSAGSPQAVQAEIAGGAADIIADGAPPAHWFRGATAKYDASAMTMAETMGYRIAGYSISGDGGATYSRKKAAGAVAAARDGDVVLAHVNQPARPAGAGVAEGILALKARGVTFVRLDDAFPAAAAHAAKTG